MTGTAVAARVRRARLLGTAGCRVLVARARGGERVPERDPRATRLFERSDVGRLRSSVLPLEAFDLSLNVTLNDPRLEGQIVFEYGALLDAVREWRGLRVLDVGSGRSTLPRWMASRGARVTAFDLPAPVESRAGGWLGRFDCWLAGASARAVHDVAGSMLDLPFASGTFDLVTSLSVLEHLDTDLPARTWVPREEQARRARRAVEEMLRVTRRGGLVYVTSECCDFARATTDRWKGAYYFTEGPDLAGAWPVGDVRAIFHDSLTALGGCLDGQDAFAPERIADPSTWTWRGPYFSVFNLLARKVA